MQKSSYVYKKTPACAGDEAVQVSTGTAEQRFTNNSRVSGFLFLQATMKICFTVFIVFILGGCHLLPKKLQIKDSDLKVGVIVSPGGARTLSALGVLKAFEENNIPVHHIVGIGWGAFLSAVYAKNQSVDEVQWSFYKLLKRGFFEISLLKHPLKPKSLDLMNQSLEENLNAKTQIQFSCPFMNRRGQKIWQTEKFLQNSVKNCLAVPPFFKLDESTGSLFSVRLAISYLKKKDMDIIIWIHVLETGPFFPRGFSKSETVFLWNELADSFHLIPEESSVYKITPSLGGFYLSDFSKMREIISKGEKEGVFFVEKLQNKFLKRSRQ